MHWKPEYKITDGGLLDLEQVAELGRDFWGACKNRGRRMLGPDGLG
jgi:hypothetical protein